MYLIDHVAGLRFVSRLIYAIKRIYTHCHIIISLLPLAGLLWWLFQ